MLSLREYKPKTGRLPDYLPWFGLVAEGVILQKDGLFQKTLRYRGCDFDSAESGILDRRGAQLSAVLTRLGSGWSYFIESQRFRSPDYPSSRWNHPGPWLIDLEQRELYTRGQDPFHMSYYITFLWRPPTDLEKRSGTWFFQQPKKHSYAGGKKKGNGRGRRSTKMSQSPPRNPQTPSNPQASTHVPPLTLPMQGAEESLCYFCDHIEEMRGLLATVMEEVQPLTSEETLSYLHSTVSLNRQWVGVPEYPYFLDALLPDMPLSPGYMPLLGEWYLSVSTITGFPHNTYPEMVRELEDLSIEYRWMNRFIALDKSDGEAVIDKYRQRFFANRKRLSRLMKEELSKEESPLLENKALLGLSQAEEALRELAEGSVAYGYYTGVIVTWDRDRERAREKGRTIRTILQGCGFVAIEETFYAREAWFSSLPGHGYANIRRPLIHTYNLSHIVPYTAVWEGCSQSPHLQSITGVGTPHITTCSRGGAPFQMNLGVGDVGHTFIAGPTGAGKSTLLSMLAIQWFRYPNAQVCIFDKDWSALGATALMGGEFYEPGGDEYSTPFQPLAFIHLSGELLWAEEFVAELCELQGATITGAEREEIHHALKELSEVPEPHRTLSSFCGLLQNRTLRTALEVYTVDGAYGSLFDGDRESFCFSHWVMFEMGVLMEQGEKVVIPALRYLFHRVESTFKGNPVLLILDEAWLFLQHPLFEGRIRSWLKTLRKRSVYVLFATQEVADAANSSIMPTILSACHSKIYLPDEEATTRGMAELYRKFGLGDRELEILATAQGKRDYYYTSPHGRRLFSLPLGGVTLALISCRERELLFRALAEKRKARSQVQRSEGLTLSDKEEQVTVPTPLDGEQLPKVPIPPEEVSLRYLLQELGITEAIDLINAARINATSAVHAQPHTQLKPPRGGGIYIS